MDSVIVLFEDEWGAILDRVGAGYLELRWFDTTESMTRDAFQRWLSAFAEEVGTCRRPGLLVDATRFRMPDEERDASWRDEHLVPHYNAAGVKRFAFLMPDGMVAIGRPPCREGNAEYPTAYFDRRADAIAWLTESASL
jgi:hypothetical protein